MKLNFVAKVFHWYSILKKQVIYFRKFIHQQKDDTNNGNF